MCVCACAYVCVLMYTCTYVCARVCACLRLLSVEVGTDVGMYVHIALIILSMSL